MMSCIDRFGQQFSLAQMYAFADHLQTLHPETYIPQLAGRPFRNYPAEPTGRVLRV
ncbi:MAG: hypothetical protein HZB91_04495 [Elusimicrobia bacterium]|nr:hypothetical protein [Elusimicrobiota bacterium]